MNFNLKKTLFTIITLLAILVLQACRHSDPGPVLGSGASGFFIVNEGAFGYGNTSLSFYDRKTDQVTNNVFSAKNGRSLGDQAQSMTVFNDKGYIVVENSAKIEIINVDDYSSLGSVTDSLPNPRYFLGISSSKAYVSDWGVDGLTGRIKIIDLSTNTVKKSIPTGKGANQMLKVNNLVYVTNSGGYGKDNTVVVINSDTDEVLTSITTGDDPNSIQRDKDGNIWVAAGGALAYNVDYSIDEANSTKGAISRISSDNKEILRIPVDHVANEGPGNLSISPDGQTLYYTYDGGLYAMSTSATAMPSTALKSHDYYGLTVDPTNGNLIGCNAPDFSSAGSIDIMDTSGKVLESFNVGIAPNGCAFK